MGNFFEGKRGQVISGVWVIPQLSLGHYMFCQIIPQNGGFPNKYNNNGKVFPNNQTKLLSHHYISLHPAVSIYIPHWFLLKGWVSQKITHQYPHVVTSPVVLKSEGAASERARDPRGRRNRKWDFSNGLRLYTFRYLYNVHVVCIDLYTYVQILI